MRLRKFAAMFPFVCGRFITILFLLLSTSSAIAAVSQSSAIAPNAQQSLLLDSAVAGESIIVVGERGHVLKSTDQGQNWQQIVVPTRVMLTAVDFIDAKRGFAVGHDAIILRTQDGGETWHIVHHAPEEKRPLLDVVVHDRRRVTAIGAYGYYLESKDAGLTWSSRQLVSSDWGRDVAGEAFEQNFADDFHLNQIVIAGSGRWYIAAEAGTIYRSDDQGRQWRRLPSPYDGSFFGVLPTAADQIVLFGMQGQMFYSDDAGENWQGVDTGTGVTLTHALMLQDGSVVVTGHSGSILLARGGSNQFELIRLPQRMAISSATELAHGGLLLVGTEGISFWSPGQR